MANNLKKIMINKGISLDDMAKMCDVSVTTVRNWRKSETLKRKKIIYICDILDISSEDLFED